MSRFCSNCGNELQDGATFCGNCGFSTQQNYNPNVNNSFVEDKDPDGHTAMICGIVGLFFCPFILCLVAISYANSSKRKHDGVFTQEAKVGYVLGIIELILQLVGFLLIGIAFLGLLYTGY